MQIKTLKTNRIDCNTSILELIDTYVPTLSEGAILIITSKIISLSEGAVVEKAIAPCKKTLIQNAADLYLDTDGEPNPHDIHLTITHNILIPSAGIDESNGNGLYILYPKDVFNSAETIWRHLKKRDHLQHVGVIISDSHSTPLRRGVVGIGLAWCGFKALYSYIGKPDCFNIPLKMTKVNILDSLTAAAVLCMGEGNEQTPFALIEEAPRVEFSEEPVKKEEIAEFCIKMEEDLYAPLLKNKRWVSKAITH